MDDAAEFRQDRPMSKLRIECAVVIFALSSNVAFGNDIDVRHFARAPQFEYASLSPDGARVSYVDQVDNRQIVFIREIDSSALTPTLRVDPPAERIRWCGWADARFVLCGTTLTARKQHAIVESTKLYSIDTTTSVARELKFRTRGPHDQVIDLMPATERRVLLQSDTNGRGFPEVIELDIGTDKVRTVVPSRPPVRSWMSDGKGVVRLGIGYEHGIATLLVRQSSEWRAVIQQSLADPESVGPLAVGAREDELYVLKHQQGRAALFRLSTASPTDLTLLHADPLFDVSGPLVLDPSSRELLAVRYLRERPTVHVFAEKERELRAWLDRELPSAVHEISARTFDGSRLLIHSSSDTNPPSLYVADVKSRRIRLLGHQFPELESRSLSQVNSFMYRARDGQRIPAYLTRPASVSSAGPAIVLPHGGPETRDVLDFDPLVQFFVARGYAVLQMNFRGSLGYGAGFAAAGARQWGGVIHNDITDGARWLVEQKIADPERLCIIGSSFGGYAALLGAARESQWYACAASFGGASDLLAFAEFTRRYPDAHIWEERLGHDSRALWEMSPLAFARQVETPVLLLHGRRDAIVPISQSRRFARALEKANRAQRLIEREDCDHDMTAESCRIAVFTAFDEFLGEAQ